MADWIKEIDSQIETGLIVPITPRRYLRKITDPEWWKKVNDSASDMTGYSKLSSQIHDIFSDNSSFSPVKSEDCDRFLDALLSNQKLKHFIAEASNTDVAQLSGDDERYLYGTLHSGFINLFADPANPLRLKSPDEQVWDRWANNMHRGRVRYDRLGQKAAEYFGGDVLHIGQAGDGVGGRMLDGTLLVDHASGSALHEMLGGVAYIESIDGVVATDWSGGVILLGHDTRNELIAERARRHIYFYDEAQERYFDFGGYAAIGERLNCDLGITSELQQRSNELFVVKDYPDKSVSLTVGMQGSILVLRDLPDVPIGDWMKEGIVIIERKDLTVTEAKKKIAPLSDRPGGVIMMRVWDDMGKSRLINLDEWEEEAQ